MVDTHVHLSVAVSGGLRRRLVWSVGLVSIEPSLFLGGRVKSARLHARIVRLAFDVVEKTCRLARHLVVLADRQEFHRRSLGGRERRMHRLAAAVEERVEQNIKFEVEFVESRLQLHIPGTALTLLVEVVHRPFHE